MKTIIVEVKHNGIEFICVDSEGWDLGAPIGGGRSKEESIESFKEDWMLKNDEKIAIVEQL